MRRRRASAGPALAVVIVVMTVATAASDFHDYTEDLTSLAFCDVENTTALWDTAAGQIVIPAFTKRIIGELSVAGSTVGVALAGDLALLACDASGLVVVDVADLSAPVVVGECDTPGNAKRVIFQLSLNCSPQDGLSVFWLRILLAECGLKCILIQNWLKLK